jgi:hypothetical protein
MLTARQLSADKNDSLDTLKEYFVSGMLYLLWILLVHREIYQIPLDYISSPLEIFYLIVGADGSNKFFGGLTLVLQTINTVIILTIPISLLLFSVPGSHGSSMLISLAAKHILLCSVGLSIATLVFSIAELTGFQCPTSSEYWGPLCWKDPLAERLWTF